MKTNKIKRPFRQRLFAAFAVIVIIAAVIGLVFGYRQLRELWLEQSVITDMSRQVTIECGRLVKADIIAENLGLKKGANLALIDFTSERTNILQNIPSLKDITISRILPGRVVIKTEEREPIARIEPRTVKRVPTGRVVDEDGVVFVCSRGTSRLPLIEESTSPGVQPGHTLTERLHAALQLIRACRDPMFQTWKVDRVDTTSPYFLVATISTGAKYLQLKLAWEDMDYPPTSASRASLQRQLVHFQQALRSGIGDSAIIWNATDYSKQGHIYADTKGEL